MSSLPTFADVQAAARRLEGVTIRTPLLENERVNRMLGGRLFLKAFRETNPNDPLELQSKPVPAAAAAGAQ